MTIVLVCFHQVYEYEPIVSGTFQYIKEGLCASVIAGGMYTVCKSSVIEYVLYLTDPEGIDAVLGQDVKQCGT